MSAANVTHPFCENGQKIRRARLLIPTPKSQVANHRPDRPISQADFADLVGVSRRHYIRLENGEQRPRGSLRDRIVEITGTEEKIESDDDEEEDVLTVLYAFIKRTQKLRRDTGDPFAMSVLK